MARLRKNVREAPISIQLAPRCCFFALDSFVARHCLFPLAPLTFTFDLRNESMVFEVWTCNRSRETCIDIIGCLYPSFIPSLYFFLLLEMVFIFFDESRLKKIISHEKDIYIYICGEWWSDFWNYSIDRVVIYYYNSRNWWIIFFEMIFWLIIEYRRFKQR